MKSAVAVVFLYRKVFRPDFRAFGLPPQAERQDALYFHSDCLSHLQELRACLFCVSWSFHALLSWLCVLPAREKYYVNFRRRNLPEGITRFRFVFPVARENLFSVRDVTRKAVFNCVFIIPHFCRFVNRKTNKSSYFFKKRETTWRRNKKIP